METQQSELRLSRDGLMARGRPAILAVVIVSLGLLAAFGAAPEAITGLIEGARPEIAGGR
ncbi:MAG: hypothetical protein AAF908_00275 [Pseudomonadota bacterium]